MSKKPQKKPPKIEEKDQTPHSETYDLITLYSFRYALGKTEYIGDNVIQWLIKNWDTFSKNVQLSMVHECEAALENGSIYTEIECKNWEMFLDFARVKTNIT